MIVPEQHCVRQRVLSGVIVPSPEVKWPGLVDIRLAGDRIVAIEPHQQGRHYDPEIDVLDLRHHIVIPGLVNGHVHTEELVLKGLVHRVPLEPYILKVAPRPTPEQFMSREQVYDRTLAVAAEMLRNGTTMVVDDIAHQSLELEEIEATLQGYWDSGIRARVSISVEDEPWRRSLPLSSGAPVRHPVLDARPNEPYQIREAYRGLAERWNPSRRVSLMVSPSAPQRCSTRMLHELSSFAREMGFPFHIHVQESLVQCVQGAELYGGRSMIAYLADEGVLGPETTIAHAVWVDDEDIARIADSGASIVHNPVSNLKLGSGVAPVRKWLDAGINVLLGTDGLTCNDSLDMFEVMKFAATLSGLHGPPAHRWLSHSEVFDMATKNAARANLWDEAGKVEVGGIADLTVLDGTGFAFTPQNDALAQTVYSAGVRDVLHVFVDGQQVVTGGRSTRVDSEQVNERVRVSARRFWSAGQHNLDQNDELFDAVEQGYLTRFQEGARRVGSYRLIADA